MDWKTLAPFLVFALAQGVALVIWGANVGSRIAVLDARVQAHDQAITTHAESIAQHEGHLGKVREDIAVTRANIEHISSFLAEMRGQLAVIVKKLFKEED